MPGGAACADDKPSCSQKTLPVVDDSGEFHGAEFRVKPSFHGCFQRARLLENLFQHEMRISALLDLAQAHLKLAYYRSLLDVLKVCNPEFFALFDECHLLFFQVNHLIGVFYDRGGVRTYEKLVLAYAYYERASLAGDHHAVGLGLVHYADSVCSHNTAKCQRNGFLEGNSVRIHHILNKLYKHFGVGLALEMIALVGKLFLERKIILYDAVVDNGELVILGDMRMSVDIAWLSVRRPSGVGYSYAAAEIMAGRDFLEIFYLSFGLVYPHLTVVIDKGDSGAVITSVFESLQTLYQDWVGLSLTYISYYSAHNS